MDALMRRDAPHWRDPDEEVVSIRVSSNIEMVSNHEYDRRPRTACPTQVLRTATTHLMALIWSLIRIEVLVFIPTELQQGSELSSALGSDADSGSDNGDNPDPVTTMGVISSDMFAAKKECPSSSKRPQSWPSSNSHSRSWETKN